MNVSLAKTAGFCFGVKRAVDMAYTEAAKGKPVYTLGPIIHNEEVVADLTQKGVLALSEEELFSGKHPLEDATVIIRSHGISKEIYTKLENVSANIVDCTCPFVKKIHTTVEKYAEKGYDIVIIGSKAHPEVQGILGWCEGHGKALETEEEAKNFTLKDATKKVCIVAQTTFNYKKFQYLVEILEKKGYSIYDVNTVCNATAVRQKEAEELAVRSEAMIVIGGTNSSNSRKLFDICKNQCENTYFIQTAEDLSSIDLSSFASLGITAGASTPNTIIQEVLRACQKI